MPDKRKEEGATPSERLRDRVVETGWVPYTVDRSQEVEGGPRLNPRTAR
jgi:hypothetical protein